MKVLFIGFYIIFCFILNGRCLAGQDDKIGKIFIEHVENIHNNRLDKGQGVAHEKEMKDVSDNNEFIFTLKNIKGGVSKSLEEKGMAIVYIEFDLGKSEVSKKYDAVIDEICTVLKEHSTWNLRIEGHTDSSGKADWNRKLSLKRAEAVGAELIRRGISSTRLSYMGCGADRPLSDTGTSEAHAKNRRVELHRF